MAETKQRLGIDLGGTKIEGVIIDDGGDVIERHRIPTPQGDYRGTLQAIAELINQLTNDQDLPVGIGTPGSISAKTGLMRNSNSTCMNGEPMLQDLEQLLKRPIRIANDADCFTLSEATDGAAADSGVVFGVILGTGVGGGICIERKLISGVNGIAGEWGHTPLPINIEQPRDCFCGTQDCVETWLSGPGLQQSTNAVFGESIAPTELAKRAEEDDPKAILMLQDYCQKLAAALAVVINILDPEKIVLGGGLSNMPQIYELTPQYLDQFVFSDFVATKIVQAKHGDSSGVRGAAWLWD